MRWARDNAAAMGNCGIKPLDQGDGVAHKVFDRLATRSGKLLKLSVPIWGKGHNAPDFLLVVSPMLFDWRGHRLASL
jgi:hypothetical protein